MSSAPTKPTFNRPAFNVSSGGASVGIVLPRVGQTTSLSGGMNILLNRSQTHIALTACGFEPTIIGFTCGAADGLLYLFEGKWGDAGLSLVSTLPLFVGSAADAGKVARLAAANKARSVGVGVVGIIKAEELVYIPKITEQLASRGWTEESVKNLISNPFTKRSAKNKANTNSATVFYNKNGAYVSVDDVTKEVIQISDIFDKYWFPDSSIINPYRP